ncbi:MAG: hypothetical protein ABIP57_19250 [Jatrophihabitantaceae bacterium]
MTAAAGALVALAGCASSTNSSTPAQHGSPSIAGSATGSSAGSPGGVPIPAPSDSEPITVGGPVGVHVLSMTGPFEPAGPFLAGSVPGLLAQIRDGLGGKAPACPTAGCWHGAKVPAGTVLVAIRPAPNACQHVQHIQSVKSSTGQIELDLQLAGLCRPGAGSAARMPAMLLAVDSAALPASGSVSIELRAAAAGATMQSIGGVSASLPLSS